eukprot:365029-Chlamydomonas_euryale.AAC.4
MRPQRAPHPGIPTTCTPSRHCSKRAPHPGIPHNTESLGRLDQPSWQQVAVCCCTTPSCIFGVVASGEVILSAPLTARHCPTGQTSRSVN